MHPATDLAAGYRSAFPLRLRLLGRRSYADGLAIQGRAARTVEAGGDDQLLLLEHPPVVTLGRGATEAQLRVSPQLLARAGVGLTDTDRGGGATYHGPGQLVGYPIVDLRRRGIGVRTFLRALEAALVDALGGVGANAFVRPPLTGVWTEAGKLAAIGIAVRRGVTRHGFALNVDTDLAAFDLIRPCGLDEPVTSLRGLGCDVDDASLGRRIGTDLEAKLAAASLAGAGGAEVTASLVPPPVGELSAADRQGVPA